MTFPSHASLLTVDYPQEGRAVEGFLHLVGHLHQPGNRRRGVVLRHSLDGVAQQQRPILFRHASIPQALAEGVLLTPTEN